MTEDQIASIQYAADWLSRSEDIGNRKHGERLRALLSASIADTAGAKVDGWKLVPVTPTEAMVRAACLKQSNAAFESYEAWHDSHSSGISARIRQLVASDYRVMIDAAPPAPSVADAAGANLDEVLADYANASQEFDAKVLNTFVKQYPQHADALHRYAQVQLTSVPATAEDVENEEIAAGASEGQADHPLDIRAYIVTDRSSGAKALKWAADVGNRFPSELYQLIPLTHHADAVAELTALRERIAGMEKDAERYRYLRGRFDECSAELDFGRDDLPIGECWVQVHQNLNQGKALDDAIDAAIAKEKQSD